MSARKARGTLLAVVALTIVLGSPGVILLPPTQKAEAQKASPLTFPPLSTPYYGSKSINSYFDHKYPTYTNPPNSTYPNVIIYTGAESGSCTPYCYDDHDGYDFNLVYERVLAAASGQVVQARWYSDRYRSGTLAAWGLYIEIDHGNGYTTRYGHLSALAVSVGQQVISGQVIGTSGNTGNSTGAHLHFGVIHNGVVTDPFGWSGGSADPWQSYSGETSLCLWYDGQWANKCGQVSRAMPTPIDGTGTNLIWVDDLDAGFTKGCAVSPCRNWFEDPTGYRNHSWYTNVTDTEDYWAQWNPNIPQQGMYEIYVYIHRLNTTTWKANYTVSYYGGQNTAIIDQQGIYDDRTGVDRWLSIGVYRLSEGTSNYVRVSSFTGEGAGSGRRVGVDAVEFVRRAPTYLPDVRVNANGWNSSVIVRTNSGNALVDAKVYDTSGNWLYTQWMPNLPSNGYWDLPLPSASGTYGVVIDASQDVAVGVMNVHEASPYTAAAYTGLDQTASTLYLPLYHNNNYGWYSNFILFNAGTQGTSPTVTLTPLSGGSCSQTLSTIPANGSVTVNPNWCGTGAGGAKVTSSQPLAAVVNQWKDYTGDAIPDSYMAYEGFPTPIDLLPFPLLMRNNYNYNSGIALQDASGTSNTGSVNYYYHSGLNNGVWCQSHSFSLSANGMQAFYPAPPNGNCTQGGGATYVGSGVADGSQVLAGIVNQVRFSVPGDYNATNYSSPRGGTKTAAVPLVMKNRDGWRGKDNWYTGLAVQNLGSTSTTVTVIYYYNSGDYVTSESKTVPANSTGIFNPAPADPSYVVLVGSAWVSATLPIAVVSNHVPNPNGTADAFMTNNGVNR